MSTQVALNTPAPDFKLSDPTGKPVQLSELWAHQHVILVFNRGFT